MKEKIIALLLAALTVLSAGGTASKPSSATESSQAFHLSEKIPAQLLFPLRKKTGVGGNVLAHTGMDLVPDLSQ